MTIQNYFHFINVSTKADKKKKPFVTYCQLTMSLRITLLPVTIKVWIYQKDNQKVNKLTTQWPQEKGQTIETVNQRLSYTKPTIMVSSYCFTASLPVIAKHPVITHKGGNKDRIVTTLNRTYPCSSVHQAIIILS